MRDNSYLKKSCKDKRIKVWVTQTRLKRRKSFIKKLLRKRVRGENFYGLDTIDQTSERKLGG